MASVLRSFKALPLRAMAPVRPTKAMPIRSFASTMLRKAGGPVPPQLYGPGGKAGEVPTDEEQATGIERLELLGDLLGVDVFDNKAPEMTRMGTLESPIPIFTLYPERIVGCTGFPADSHDTNWIRCEVSRKHNRCNECGCVYTLDFQGDKSLLEHHDDHHH